MTQPLPETRTRLLSRVAQAVAELAVLALAPIALGGSLYVFTAQQHEIEEPSAHAITSRNMEVLDRRVRNHKNRTGKLPKGVAEVTFAAQPVDGYGHPLELVRVSADRWEIWSRGADGARGGDGQDADVSWTMLRALDAQPDADADDTLAQAEVAD